MDLITQQRVFDDYTTKMRDIMLKKGNDYATADRLSNFKRVGEIVGISPEQVIMTLIATKVVRLSNLLQPSAGAPNNESIEDNLIDLDNYGLLLAMVREENNPKYNPPTHTAYTGSVDPCDNPAIRSWQGNKPCAEIPLEAVQPLHRFSVHNTPGDFNNLSPTQEMDELVVKELELNDMINKIDQLSNQQKYDLIERLKGPFSVLNKHIKLGLDYNTEKVLVDMVDESSKDRLVKLATHDSGMQSLRTTHAGDLILPKDPNQGAGIIYKAKQ